MEAEDRSWDLFLDAYARLVKRHGELAALCSGVIGRLSDHDVDTKEYTERLEVILSGKDFSDSKSRDEN